MVDTGMLEWGQPVITTLPTRSARSTKKPVIKWSQSADFQTLAKQIQDVARHKPSLCQSLRRFGKILVLQGGRRGGETLDGSRDSDITCDKKTSVDMERKSTLK